MILRNFLFKLLQNRTADGYHIDIRIDGVNRSDERNSVAEQLVKLGCLRENWIPIGRNGIQGQFDYDKIEELIKSGSIG